MDSLTVVVVRAQDLLDADTFGKSDPFLKLYVGSQMASTTIKKGTLNPEWNERFEFQGMCGFCAHFLIFVCET